MNSTKNLTIIGAGLTGLSLAYFLRKQEINITLLEAQEQIGGRILTIKEGQAPPIEMGATWIGKQHTKILKLLNDLGLEVFEQTLGPQAIYEAISTSPPQLVKLPPNNDPSYRIAGGTISLLDGLKSFLTPEAIQYNTIVRSITQNDQGLITKQQRRTANRYGDLDFTTLSI